jgi:hypothetical protein
VNWCHVTQGRAQRRALVNTVMKFLDQLNDYQLSRTVPEGVGQFLLNVSFF